MSLVRPGSRNRHQEESRQCVSKVLPSQTALHGRTVKCHLIDRPKPSDSAWPLSLWFKADSRSWRQGADRLYDGSDYRGMMRVMALRRRHMPPSESPTV